MLRVLCALRRTWVNKPTEAKALSEAITRDADSPAK